jgi:hypothetical protein
LISKSFLLVIHVQPLEEHGSLHRDHEGVFLDSFSDGPAVLAFVPVPGGAPGQKSSDLLELRGCQSPAIQDPLRYLRLDFAGASGAISLQGLSNSFLCSSNPSAIG